MIAAEWGNVSCLEPLLRHGADVEAKDDVSNSLITFYRPKLITHDVT